MRSTGFYLQTVFRAKTKGISLMIIIMSLLLGAQRINASLCSCVCVCMHADNLLYKRVVKWFVDSVATVMRYIPDDISNLASVYFCFSVRRFFYSRSFSIFFSLFHSLAAHAF